MNIKAELLNPRLSPFMALGKSGRSHWAIIIGAIIIFALAVWHLDKIASRAGSLIFYYGAGQPDHWSGVVMMTFFSALTTLLFTALLFAVVWVLQLLIRQQPLKNIITSRHRFDFKSFGIGFGVAMAVFILTQLLWYAVFYTPMDAGVVEKVYFNNAYTEYGGNALFWPTVGLALCSAGLYSCVMSIFTEGFIAQNLSAQLSNKLAVITVSAAIAVLFYAAIYWVYDPKSIYDIMYIYFYSAMLAALVVTGRGLEIIFGIVAAAALFSELIFSDNNATFGQFALFRYDGPTDSLSYLAFSVLSTVLIGLIIFKVRKPVTSDDYIESIYD